MAMRVFFLLLLLVNGIFFVWLRFGYEPEASTPGTGVAATQLQLLSEVAPPIAASDGRFCMKVGPLEDAEARGLADRLHNSGLNIEAEIRKQLEPLGYWVYLPPSSTMEEAKSVARRLAARGIKDFMFVVGAEKANAISLGLYPEARDAERRRNELLELGFAPEIERRYQPETHVYLTTLDPVAAESVKARLGDKMKIGACKVQK